MSFAIFTYCAGAWAKMSLFAMHEDHRRKVDIGIWAVIAVMSCLIIGFPIGIAQSTNIDTQANVAIAATWTMAMVSMLLCLTILVLGVYLAWTVRQAYQNSSSSTTTNQSSRQRGEALANKILIAGVVFAICFFIESICWICSISKPYVYNLNTIVTITGVFLAAFAGSLVALLVMLWKAVEARMSLREMKDTVTREGSIMRVSTRQSTLRNL